MAEETGTGLEAEPSRRAVRRAGGKGQKELHLSPPPSPDPLSFGLHVWQTGPTVLEDERVPSDVRDTIEMMKYKNPEVTFEYLDDAQQRDWVVEHMTPEVVGLYDGLPNNVMRADLWRYMVVATEGGLYLDSDAGIPTQLRYWDVLNPAKDFGCEVVIGMENNVNMCQWAILSLVPRHPLMVHAVRFILSRIALHAKESIQWTELLRLPEPRDFVHAATGPGVWTEAIVDFFDDGAEDWKRARERGNEKENRRASILAADIMDIFRQRGTTIEANNVVGYAVPTSSGRHRSPADFLLREARTSGPGQLESSGNVCFFLADMMNSRLIANGYLSQWGEERKGNSNAWKSWIRTRWDLGFLSEIRAAFRHLDADGDGKLTVAEISPAQGLVSAVLRSHHLDIHSVELLASQSQGDESEPTWNTRFGLPQNPHIWCDLHASCYEVNTLHLAMATALSEPHQFLQTSDRDLDGALSFEELNWALDEVVAVSQYNERVLRGTAPEPRQSPEAGLRRRDRANRQRRDSQLPPVASAIWASPRTSMFLSEIRTVFHHLDVNGDGKLELFEIYPLQSFVSTRFEVENDGAGNDSLLMRRFGLIRIQLLEKKDLPPQFIEDIDRAFSDPENLLRTYDKDLDLALTFDELRKALEDVEEGKGLSPEPPETLEPEPPKPPEFPQRTGWSWEIDTGDYSGLAGLTVAVHGIIDPDDDFADSFEGMGSSTAWLFVAAGAVGLLAAGVWCTRARLARQNGHGRRRALKAKAR